MIQTELIIEFLSKKKIAVVGVSRKGDIPANHIFHKFKDAGYDVYPVNPHAEVVEGLTCYPDISSLPEKPEAVMLAGTPVVSEKVMQECLDNHVDLVWMHKGIGQGSYSPKADQLAGEKGITVIKNGCPMMFVGKVDPFHKVLKWIKKF